MKRNYLSYILLTCMLGSVAACNVFNNESNNGSSEKEDEPAKHEHSFNGDFVTTEEEHWKVCDDKDCDEISEKGQHEFGNSNICKVCGYDNGKGYVKQPVSFTINQAAGVYTPESGNLKMFVIPVNLIVPETALEEGHYLDSWTDEVLEDFNNMYFGSGISHGHRTFKDYFEECSYGKVRFSGQVSGIVDLEFTAEEFYNNFYDDDGSGYVPYLSEIVSKGIQSVPDFDKAGYDTNNDGYFDAINIVTNYHGAEWGESWFWPHMTTCDVKVSGGLNVRSFSFDSIEFMSETGAMAPNHEQGHIFGVPDYYDYTYKTNYIGNFDEQCSNDADWNAFSKMITGWIEPTVVTGEVDSVTVTLNSTQDKNNPGCLVIPADYSTYNGSAFDEYFLVELINDTGNNALFYKSQFGWYCKGYGVRVSHVYADLYGYVGEFPFTLIDSAEDCENYFKNKSLEKMTMFGSNNNYNTGEFSDGFYDGIGYWPNNKKYNNYPLYAVIQNGFDKTFGTTTGRTEIREADLFYTGDSFTFKDVRRFIAKDSKSTKMANGESFPYKVTFDNVTHDNFTVTVTKN